MMHSQRKKKKYKLNIFKKCASDKMAKSINLSNVTDRY